MNKDINIKLLSSINGVEVRKNGRILDRELIIELDPKDKVRVKFFLEENKELKIDKSGEYNSMMTVEELNIYLNLGVEVI